MSDPVLYPWAVRQENRYDVLAGFFRVLARWGLPEQDRNKGPGQSLGRYGSDTGQPGSGIGFHDEKRHQHGKISNEAHVSRLTKELLRSLTEKGVDPRSKLESRIDHQVLHNLIERTVRTHLLLRAKTVRDPNLLINPLTLTSGYYSGASMQYSPTRVFIFEMLMRGSKMQGDSGLIADLYDQLRGGGDDVLSCLVDTLIAPGKWPRAVTGEPRTPRRISASERFVLPFRATRQIARDVRALLRAHEDKRIDRPMFNRLFRNVVCLRLAQYHLSLIHFVETCAKVLIDGDAATGKDLARQLREGSILQHGIRIDLGAPLNNWLERVVLPFPWYVDRISAYRKGIDDPPPEPEALAQLLESGMRLDPAKASRPKDREVQNNLQYLRSMLYWQGEDDAGGCARLVRGKSIVVRLSDDVLHALVYGAAWDPGSGGTDGVLRSRVNFDAFVENIEDAFCVPLSEREELAARLVRAGMVREMPDAERFREVVLP